MAYKYEVEQKAKQLRLRVLIAIYILFVISAAIIGVSVRLQQIKNIQPSRPGATDVGTSGYTLASDPTYTPRNLGAFAYCAVVDSNGKETGLNIPISGGQFLFKQVGKRDVGQIRSNPTNTQNTLLCTSVPAGCTLDGQTVAQCQTSVLTCDAVSGSTKISAGVICPVSDERRIASANGLATWPGSENSLSDLRWDDNEIVVMVDTDYGVLGRGELTYDSATHQFNCSIGSSPTCIAYQINKSSALMNSAAFTPDLGSLLPFYKWRCQSGCVAGSTSCFAGGATYLSTACSFSGNVFHCPENKFAFYDQSPFVNDATDDYFMYYKIAAYKETTSSGGPRENHDPRRVHVGVGYEGMVDGTYPAITDSSVDDLVAFKGNLIKYRFTCLAMTTTQTPTPTQTPTTTPTPTPTEYLLTARKTGPVCVTRVAPDNKAVFTITVNNNGTNRATVTAVNDSLPQGFLYSANTTTVNGVAVPDTYVTITVTGNSQLVKFARPIDAGGPWTFDPNTSLVIQFTAIAGPNAISGTNTNQVVIDVQNHDSIDHVTYQFEVAQTCVPITGIFDDPIYVIGASTVIIVVGLYLIYNPKAVGFAEKLYGRVTITRKQLNKTAKALKENASPRKRFEDKVKKNLGKKRIKR